MYIHKDPHFVSGNEIKAAFMWEDLTMCIVKAFDEESNGHYIIAQIPEIPALKVQNIQFPMRFETEQQRDFEYDDFCVDEFMNFLISEIKSRNDKNKPVSNKGD